MFFISNIKASIASAPSTMCAHDQLAKVGIGSNFVVFSCLVTRFPANLEIFRRLSGLKVFVPNLQKYSGHI
ncbi:hypothetical protein Nepgr_018229 [Nepenthes gracilis]|uniref:Uncharacterized protein n=1 Tax=Nepenthes gracilis TaxID=150966 RepID=A0AAD3SRW6_NEPGR|nr:hypothetical protein Nepgr_018229 [Nepenthes gracilis]